MNRPFRLSLRIGALLIAGAAACRRAGPSRLDPVRAAIRNAAEPRFQAPADGLLTGAHVDAYLRVRRQVHGAGEFEAARSLGIDPAQYVWTRARIMEAVGALDSRRATDAALDSTARALAVLREARRGTRDARAAARIDVEIAGLEKERATLRKVDPLPAPLQQNAALVSSRRSEIEAAGL